MGIDSRFGYEFIISAMSGWVEILGLRSMETNQIKKIQRQTDLLNNIIKDAFICDRSSNQSKLYHNLRYISSYNILHNSIHILKTQNSSINKIRLKIYRHAIYNIECGEDAAGQILNKF